MYEVHAVHRECMSYLGAATGAEWQTVEVMILRGVGSKPVRIDLLSAHWRTDRETADVPRCRQIAVHEGGRHLQHAGDVVEAVAHVIGRKPLRDVEVERQQIAHRVPVLRAVEAMERLGAARIRVGRRGAVQRGFEPPRQAVIRRPIRPRPAGRRHHARPELPHDLLPDLRGVIDVIQVECIESQTGRLQPVIVTRDAVAIEQRAMRGAGLGRGGRKGLRCVRIGGTEGIGGAGQQNPDPDGGQRGSRNSHRRVRHPADDGRRPASDGRPPVRTPIKIPLAKGSGRRTTDRQTTPSTRSARSSVLASYSCRRCTPCPPTGMRCRAAS